MRGARGIMGSFGFVALFRFGFDSVASICVWDVSTVVVVVEAVEAVTVTFRLRTRTGLIVGDFGVVGLTLFDWGEEGRGGRAVLSGSRSVREEDEALDMGTAV
jgi:hypothetical protein